VNFHCVCIKAVFQCAQSYVRRLLKIYNIIWLRISIHYIIGRYFCTSRGRKTRIRGNYHHTGVYYYYYYSIGYCIYGTMIEIYYYYREQNSCLKRDRNRRVFSSIPTIIIYTLLKAVFNRWTKIDIIEFRNDLFRMC